MSNGTSAGTMMVKDIGPGSSSPYNLANVNGTLFFMAYDGQKYGLWKSDGTAEKTLLISDILVSYASSYPDYLTNLNGTLFFRASNGTYGSRLWKSDGTADGTVMINGVSSGPYYPQYLTNVNGMLFFIDYGKSTSYALWKSDGTAAGTVMVKDIATASGYSPQYLTNVNGTLYFVVNKGSTLYELWKSDGTEAGTVRVQNIVTASSSPYYLTDCNGMLFFVVNDGTNGAELWKSDGTADGTVMVKDICPGSNSSSPQYLTNVNGMLFFSANDGTNGYELWKSNGTPEGTMMVKDIYFRSMSSHPYNLVNVNGTLFFRAGYMLWKSDGTTVGTIPVNENFNINSSPYSPYSLMNVNGTLFFVASTEINGYELWKSDGTAEGTVMVKDICPGSYSSYPSNLTNVNGMLFFTVNDGLNGTELWKSDGTAEGTVMVKDIYPGSASSNPYNLTNVNGKLFFTASDFMHGTELWCQFPDPPCAPRTPGSPGARAIGVDTISWTWVDTWYNENGFKLWADMGPGEPIVLRTTTPAGITSWIYSNLLHNTQYSFQVAATNAVGDSLRTANFSAYTLIEPVGALSFSDIGTNTISVGTSSTPRNLTAGLSGLYFANTTVATASGWQQTNAPWVSGRLSPNKQYMFSGRSRNGDGVETVPITATKWTLAAVPTAPAWSSPQPHSLGVAIGSGDGNPAATEYAIYCETTSQWVQANGTLGNSPVWAKASTWGMKTVTGLVGATAYSFHVRARNGENMETADGPSTCGNTQCTLTYSAGENGSITGTSPQTVNYGANGSQVTAVPATGYHFEKWSDGVLTASRTDMDVRANLEVTASFTINTYTLTYNAGENGSITGSSPQTVNHGTNGSPVTAIPATGYHFEKWSDGSTANPRTDANVTGDITVTAYFAINTYTLTYNAGEHGSITGSSAQTVNYGANSSQVTAVPVTGYHFEKWSDGVLTASRIDTDVKTNLEVTAYFTINTYMLTYKAGANGSISGTSPQTVNHGADGTAVTAVPDLGYYFAQWNDGSTVNPRTDLKVTGDITVTASFMMLPKITSISPSLTTNAGENVSFSVTATGAEPLSYQWLKGGQPIADDPRITGKNGSTLSITDITEADEADYACVVSNAGGTVTSGNVRLTVNNTPQLGAIATPIDPVNVTNAVQVSTTITDPDQGETHTATWDWGDGKTSAGEIAAATGKLHSKGYFSDLLAGLAEIERVMEAGVKFGLVQADAAYGMVAEFRRGLVQLGLRYTVGILKTQKVYSLAVRQVPPPPDKSGRPPKAPQWSQKSVPVAELIAGLGEGAWQRLSWRAGTKGPLEAEFIAVRVRAADGAEDGHQQHAPGEEVWLIAERRAGGELRYYFSNLPPRSTLRRLARSVKGRWACEQPHQQLKEELGLDHYEGRSWLGLHHHCLMAMIAYCFLQHLRLGGKKRGSKLDRRPSPACPRSGAS